MGPNGQNDPFCPLKTCVNINGGRGGLNIIGLDWNFVWELGAYRRSTGEMSSMIWKKVRKITHPTLHSKPQICYQQWLLFPIYNSYKYIDFIYILGCVVFRTFFQIMLLISPVDLLYAPNFHTKFQSNPIIFKPPPSTVYVYTCFQCAKRLILAVWPNRPNYASIHIFKLLKHR